MRKKIILIIFLGILCSCFIYLGYLSYTKMNTPGLESDITGKGLNNEEYLYKEDLLHLGYKVDEIEVISKKISEIDVKKFLLTKKYNDLIKFIECPHFYINNIERYQNYYDNNDYSHDEVIMNVEIGIDNDFYTNINKVDTTKNELMLINKYYSLDSTYTPTLVSVEKAYGSGKADKTAYEYFKKMVDAAKKDGLKLWSVSFYRSYEKQQAQYNSYCKRDGVKNADTYSARPGHSEHQTGLSVDINTAGRAAKFETTKEYQWLVNNSYKYGYILRYPENKTYITGYIYEPWHYRYVGIEVATKIFQEQITYEEYYVKYLKY